MKSITINCLDDLNKLQRIVRSELNEHGKCELFIEEDEKEKQRTLSQNASLHKYCATIAERMTEGGYTQRELIGTFKEGFELPVTSHMIKDIFRTVGKAMYKKESTKDLSTVEIQEVYRVVDQRFGEVSGCRAEWPSRESQMIMG